MEASARGMNPGRLDSVTDSYHTLVKVEKSISPIILSAPHGGSEIPEDMREYVSGGVRDVNTDTLVFEIGAKAKELGFHTSHVVARGARALLDLNCGEGATRGIPELKEYYWAYHRVIRALIGAAVAKFGFAMLLDLHGYDESKHNLLANKQSGQMPICLGTRYGSLIPREFRPAYDAFRCILTEKGFSVYPKEGFEEYGPFIGGGVVSSFMGKKRVMAIQMETPQGIRRVRECRKDLAKAVAEALLCSVEEISMILLP